MELGLKGKKAIIIGGTRSIGRAMVEVFSKESVNIAFWARNSDLIGETVAATESNGVRAFGEVVDVADPKRLERWIREAAEKLDGIDLLVPTPSAQAFKNSEQDWAATFNVDLIGGRAVV